jgi:predicted nucleic acid-binding Zn ribbon protein
MLFTLADCLVPVKFDWKKAQEEEPTAPSSSPVPVYPRLPLAQAAREAAAAGMTYGQYMAQRGIFPPPPKHRRMPSYLEPYLNRCSVCGAIVPKGRKKYCSHGCMYIAQQRRDAQSARGRVWP